MFDDFMIAAAGLKLVYALAAAAGLIALSSVFDQRAKRTFRESLETIAREPLALAVYYGLRIVALALLVGLLVGCTGAQAGPVIPDRYDRQIARAVATWWPDYPSPAAWKAQLYQESRLEAGAVSPVGAAGLAQMMPATWAQITREMRLGRVSPHHEVAIDAGAYYMRKLRGIWSAPRPADDRQRLAQASYNAGPGSILKAQAACDGAATWAAIAPCLPLVTGRHAVETTGYVASIARWRQMIEARL